MAKFYGKIGYVETKEVKAGVWQEVVTEKQHSGEVLRNTGKWQTSGNINDDISVSNQFSIVADAFAYANFNMMRYIVWMGVPWKITNIELLRPRLTITIGGVYNGEVGQSSSTP